MSDQVDLGQFKEGDAIQFEIEKTGDWDYVVTRLLKGAEASDTSQMDHDMASDEMNAGQDDHTGGH
ncbi:hypothetical protein A3752_22005 [Oleiphilus sp. HI0081]|nr:hypothetical protein A3752_22005 [Oleiphilus sp. HI0081]